MDRKKELENMERKIRLNCELPIAFSPYSRFFEPYPKIPTPSTALVPTSWPKKP